MLVVSSLCDACTVSVCSMHESLAPRASPDGIFWISHSVSASPLILTCLYLVCLSCQDATDRFLIIMEKLALTSLFSACV